MLMSGALVQRLMALHVLGDATIMPSLGFLGQGIPPQMHLWEDNHADGWVQSLRPATYR